MKRVLLMMLGVYMILTMIAGGEEGVASIYTVRSNHGRTTASGIALVDNANMVAHKTYPFGTKLLITNVENSQSAVGIVVDRGPYVAGRIVDVTLGIAEKMGLAKTKGITKVKIMVVGKVDLKKYKLEQ